MNQDPYKVLGVSKSADQDAIKTAYRKLAKKYHPDLNPGNTKAEKKFKEISEAYRLIGTPENREKFDRGEFEYMDAQQTGKRQGPFYYQTQQEGGRYTESFGDLGKDIFESIFRGAGAEELNLRGGDHFYQMEIDFKDAVLGAKREITLMNGKKLLVKIPPGIETGKKLRFAGAGEPGVGKAPAGDVYVDVLVRPSPIFSRSGNDLEMELPVSLTEAILGGEVEIPTLDQPVILKIPPGVNTGTRLRVKEKGGVDPAHKTRGNLIVILKVILPSQIDPELKEAVQKWSQTHPYDPRSNKR
jgi:DnaJ-class molecular chaperone